MKRIFLAIIISILTLQIIGCGLTSKDTNPQQGEFAKLNVYVASGSGLAYSKNSGSSWEHYMKTKTNNIPDNHLNTLYIVDEKTFWIGTDKGLAVTTDNAKTWESYTINDGLGGNSIQDILLNNNILYVG
ncbi:MAG: hypothetical protein KKA19_00375, partial [Candidatus Margulisbacteria bacterium]|nr:hypothetical protein [Candidatus Margulisiibacteriota bacterium]